jgi:hypothetical protein
MRHSPSFCGAKLRCMSTKQITEVRCLQWKRGLSLKKCRSLQKYAGKHFVDFAIFETASFLSPPYQLLLFIGPEPRNQAAPLRVHYWCYNEPTKMHGLPTFVVDWVGSPTRSWPLLSKLKRWICRQAFTSAGHRPAGRLRRLSTQSGGIPRTFFSALNMYCSGTAECPSTMPIEPARSNSRRVDLGERKERSILSTTARRKGGLEFAQKRAFIFLDHMTGANEPRTFRSPKRSGTQCAGKR